MNTGTAEPSGTFTQFAQALQSRLRERVGDDRVVVSAGASTKRPERIAEAAARCRPRANPGSSPGYVRIMGDCDRVPTCLWRPP